jgi:hypothetical protein
MLIIKLTEAELSSRPTLKVLTPVSGCCGSPRPSEVLKQVLEAAEQANSELGTHYGVAEIRFVEDDSPNEAIYGYLTRKIIENLAAGAEFTPSTYGDDEL